jgi:hypothetical protein
MGSPGTGRYGTGAASACDELLPAPGVATASGLKHLALHARVPLDLGHLDPHEPSLACAAARRGTARRPGDVVINTCRCSTVDLRDAGCVP